ncbi:helix-turn-helix transcriptional regulator [Providencia alcalifaciens]|uniref:helix-turn-helix transcriptional regulator n=1 Tax=Providencia alcalifaciens TaxID=126385 RepID=UPI001CC430D1|nr:PAS domain-containing protein [Providencia alcalifaciens]CAG9416418.1 Transcriptional regulator DauR [Providencia alcalifaciens]CAG9420509.1 Transcriptional regulator DauR [Providencia alcalifaciens]CAG9420550.1 Transcriptional regulator DauR [Providencia alcalifaciens]CAG9421483.1 Transcriptional regulator DauR [Providencia alcalifaciens]CAG9421706.1 Transcriptional regulator DauR [Providencia alcalifaciens]
MAKPKENSLLAQIEAIAQGLSETFAPFCEVVVHDLKNPEHSIISIHNNLSGRKEGEATTELGLARIESADFPNIITNYANQFPDGRPAKSTSIGIKDETGQYVAALCLNLDMTQFRNMQSMLSQFTEVGCSPVKEHLESNGSEAIRARIDQYAASIAATPRTLKADDRVALIELLRKEGLLDIKKSMDTIAQHLGVSRASVYLYAKKDS